MTHTLRIPALVLVVAGWGLSCCVARAHEDDHPHQDGVLMFFQAADVDHDWIVPLTDLSAAYGFRLDVIEPRRMRLVQVMDQDGDGLVTLREFRDGIDRLIQVYTDRLLSCDVDSDGALSLTEYALAVPDPNGERKENGVTPRQTFYFARLDMDRDQQLTRAEVEQMYRTARIGNLRATANANRMLAADSNDDRLLDEQEFAAIFDADGELTEPVNDLFRKYKRVEDRIDHASLRNRCFQLKGTALLAHEFALDAWELRRRLDASAKWLVELCDQDADQAISFAEHAAAHGLTDLRESDLQTLLTLDQNQDQLLHATEIVSGLRALVEHQFVRPAMAVDVDANGVLSPQEYALSVPDPGAEVLESGLTDRQQEFFQDLDRDGNGEISHAEMTHSTMQIAVRRLEANALMAAMFRLDTDQNNALSASELLALAGDSATVQDELQSHFDVWTQEATAPSALSRLRLEQSLALSDDRLLARLHSLVVSFSSPPESVVNTQ